jgi:hypothetical protein
LIGLSIKPNTLVQDNIVFFRFGLKVRVDFTIIRLIFHQRSFAPNLLFFLIGNIWRQNIDVFIEIQYYFTTSPQRSGRLDRRAAWAEIEHIKNKRLRGRHVGRVVFGTCRVICRAF